MADKEVYIREGDSSGMGIIAGVFVVLLIGIGLLFVTGGLRIDRDVNVSVDALNFPMLRQRNNRLFSRLGVLLGSPKRQAG